MSWVPDTIVDFAGRMSVTEAVILLGLFAILAGGLIGPSLVSLASRRAFARREAEFRRLQNM